jgi:DNA-binding HxlR family transcriptional regulator
MSDQNIIGLTQQEIPAEVLGPLKLLADDTRLAIVLALLKNGDMTFSQLQHMIKIKPNSLSHHLRSLVQGALLRNYYSKKAEADEYSFYGVTSIARDFIDGILGTVVKRPSLSQVFLDFVRADQKYEEKFLDLLSSMNEYGQTQLEGTGVVSAVLPARAENMRFEGRRRISIRIPPESQGYWRM